MVTTGGGEHDRLPQRGGVDSTRTWPRRPTPALWVGAVLVLVSFLQAPGKITSETKLDLAMDPAGFLGRALHMWNPQATSGELQNQAYGYLFPMGPYFVALDAIGVPTWIAQRLWCAILLCLAFGGALLLARSLRIGTEPSRLVGAVAYALAPRMITEIGVVSAEMMPAAMLPWVMLPLVRAERIGSPRRAAGLSALAVLGMGGVNGAMVVMALVLPGLWLLTRRWTRGHVKLVAWWCVFVPVVSLWWILPLLLLGRYSLPFLDYIESAATTTGPLSLFQVLRGTDQWVAYIVQDGPWWPAGWAMINNPVLIVATGVVAALALWGLADSRLPERRFLVLAAITGLTFLAVGFVGELGSPFAETARELLDGPLAPLRNVHKFDPVLRLALALAFMHAVTVLGIERAPRTRWSGALWTAGAAALVVVAAAPAFLFMLRLEPGWDETPRHWQEAMSWVAERDEHARTLLVPSTGFGLYDWGRTIDEPAQPLASSPWAVRNQIPLGSEGNTRMMDAVDEVLAHGRGDPHLADMLARSGFRFLLLRNDIPREKTEAPPLSRMHEGLAASPGLRKVADFGPTVQPGTGESASVVDTTAPPVASVQIYEVESEVPRATATPLDEVTTVSGGPESLLPLMRSGQLDPRTPVVLTGDGGAGGERVVTDGLRDRERDMGRVRENLSATRTSEQPTRFDRGAQDLLPVRGEQHRTFAELRGITSVSASTAASYADSAGRVDPTHQPFAAVDGDPTTAWHSSSFSGPDGQWLEVDLPGPRDVDSVDLSFVEDLRVGWPASRIRITTDQGSIEHSVQRGGGTHSYPTRAGPTSKVRVTVLSLVVGRQDGNVGISELAVPGVEAERLLRVPSDTGALAAGPRPGFTFSRGPAPEFACQRDASGATRCDAGLAQEGEEPRGPQRLFSTDTDGTYQVGGTVLPAPGGVVPFAPQGLDVTASSQLGGDPAAGPFAAIDGDAATAWVPDVTDLDRSLRLSWDGPREISGMRLFVDNAHTAIRPNSVEIVTPEATYRSDVDAAGRVEFPPVTTDVMEIRITGFDGQDPVTGQPTNRHAGIGTLELTGAEDLLTPADPETPFTVPCGQGPPVTIDGVEHPTSVRGTIADVTGHRTLPLIPCDDLAEDVPIPAGEHEIRTAPSDAFVVQGLWLRPAEDGPRAEPAPSRPVEVTDWNETSRSLDLAPGPRSVLSVPENANQGWVARLDGERLEPTRVDGWQQAWVVPEGAGGEVTLDFEPNSRYRGGLLAGGFAALAVVGATFLPVRRRQQVSTAPSGGRMTFAAVAGLLAVLGGIPGVVALAAGLGLRWWRPSLSPWFALGGMAVATTIAFAGQVLGFGQEWANAGPSQAAALLAVGAVIGTCLDFSRRGSG
ncbi:DUF3367 domain-containing protein [Allosaccharopolyspora coralli]|uniref:DUF3367 domain-containing protein n=1 Tax=Allosaccharopolyspora coralli TaxID=2665642 RepID=A0A5Q3Q4Z2_9PSEU|nr:alpha-(1->3)-arabinofuranosyltransferase [Allosaccharopolyspora coralli]QGK68900.1 DUF3367 domain-containing protein [Allosaccharopolyspora coralli]